MPLLIKRHDNFSELQRAWELLAPKAGCSLFTGWHWQQGWWQTWGNGLELQLYSFCTHDGTVVGIAPLFMRQYRLKRVLTLRQLQPVGNLYPGDETVLSEYLDLIIDPAFTDAAHVAFLSLLDKLAWDEFAMPLVTAGSHYYRLLSATSTHNTRYVIEEKKEGAGIRVDTRGEFAAYVAGLGKNTRLKLYNRRTLLNQTGTVELEFANTGDAATQYLEELNNMASARWGRPPFGNKSLGFHQQLARDAVAAGLLRLSRLRVNGTTISLLYNLRFGTTEYNIQAAYEENFHAKISPGTLHLGYAIEQACENTATTTFDLLFGEGKNVFYKRHFNGESTDFFTLIAMKSLKARLILLARQLYRRLRSRYQHASNDAPDENATPD